MTKRKFYPYFFFSLCFFVAPPIFAAFFEKGGAMRFDFFSSWNAACLFAALLLFFELKGEESEECERGIFFCKNSRGEKKFHAENSYENSSEEKSEKLEAAIFCENRSKNSCENSSEEKSENRSENSCENSSEEKSEKLEAENRSENSFEGKSEFEAENFSEEKLENRSEEKSEFEADFGLRKSFWRGGVKIKSVLDSASVLKTLGLLLSASAAFEAAAFFLGTRPFSKIIFPKAPPEFFACAATIFSAAFYEEVMYRAFLPFSLKKIFERKKDALGKPPSKKNWAAIFASEFFSILLFALAHAGGGALSVLNAAFSGAALRTCFLKTGRVWAGFFAHAFYNAIALALAFAFFKG